MDKAKSKLSWSSLLLQMPSSTISKYFSLFAMPSFTNTPLKLRITFQQINVQNPSTAKPTQRRICGYIKGPCATLEPCVRAVLSERVNKPYMNCKQHEKIGKAMAANHYGSPVQQDLEDHLYISG